VDLHPLVRDYATEQAMSSGLLTELGLAHADHFRAWVMEASLHLQDAEQRIWLRRVEQEHDNVRGALAYYVEVGDGKAAAEICLALAELWSIHGHLAEGRERLRTVLALEPPEEFYRQLLNVAGELAWIQGDYPEARTALDRALPMHEAAADDAATAAARHRLGSIAGYEANYDQAEQIYRTCLDIKARLNDEVSTAKTLTNFAITLMHRGDLSQAQTLHEQALITFRAHRHEHFSAISLTNLGDLAIERAAAAEAEENYRQALQILYELGDEQRMAFALDGMGRAALINRRTERAVRLWGAAADLRTRFATILPPAEREWYEEALACARRSLPAARYASRWHEGEQMTAEEALGYALAAD
jgi:tetratricopeptide (TPR) repeat protein